jgi:DTW domain-containing protein YfiP
MQAALPTRRATCDRCARPLRTCLCRFVTATANQVSVLILQHPMEVGQAKGSARLLASSLATCQREAGEQFDPAALAGWLAADASGAALRPARCLLLYPDADDGDDAQRAWPATATPPPALPLPHPETWRLVLLDGTWRKTRKLLHVNPLLRALPRWALPAPPPSRYGIRRAQRPQQRSTLEAACLALGWLEGQPARYAPLLAAFDGWVQAQADMRPV